MAGAGDLLFEVQTPLGFRVRVTNERWDLIVTVKHAAMAGSEAEVKQALENPDEIRQSRGDTAVFLFYRTVTPRRWICAVAQRTDGDGFLITAYPTDAIKEGTKVWPK